MNAATRTDNSLSGQENPNEERNGLGKTVATQFVKLVQNRRSDKYTMLRVSFHSEMAACTRGIAASLPVNAKFDLFTKIC